MLHDAYLTMRLKIEDVFEHYGIRDERVLRLLWYDQHHGTKNAVYLTKNT